MTTVDILYPASQVTELFKNQGREHPNENLSYSSKICRKRFVSGRAPGVHMKAHVPASMPVDTFTETEFQKSKRPVLASDDKSMEYKDDENGLDSNGSNVSYALQRNPKRSWPFADREDSFLWGHGFDSKPIVSSINFDLSGKEFKKDEEEGTESDADIEIDRPSGNSSRLDKWLKGKRFKRPRYALQLNPRQQFGSTTNNEEEEMAMCLLLLASAVSTARNPQFQVGAAEPESGDLKLPNTGSQLPKCIRKKPKYKKIDGDAAPYNDDEVKKARYKCTTCNKAFHSHQALGGHRSSHKKVNDCFSQIDKENERLEEEITDEKHNTGSDSQLPRNFHKPPLKEKTNDSCFKAMDETRTLELAAFSGKKTLGVHECSICHRVFASGQALGGHKSRHWVSAGDSDTIRTISSIKETAIQQHIPARVELLDLNLPAPVDDDCDAGNVNNLGGNAVDSHGASYAQTHSPPYLQSWLIGSSPKQGLSLFNNRPYVSKNDEADDKVGKEITFGIGCDSEFPVKAQSWLRL